MFDDDETYYRGRIASERRRVALAGSYSARLAHQQLLNLYAIKLADILDRKGRGRVPIARRDMESTTRAN